MHIEILSKNNNTLMGRMEYIFEVAFESSTPKRDEIKQKIIEKTGNSPDLTVIKKIQQHTGMKKAKIIAYSYIDEETMRRTEPHYILKRNGKIKEEPKEAGAEEKKKGRPKKE